MSEEFSHSATTVYAVLQKLLPKVKDIFPEVKCIHYLTHSSTSQYRNRTIFQLVARHEEDFGVKARWDYLEAGHGKGLCDGLGVSVNRSAISAVTQGRAVIQSAEDFFAWSQQISGLMPGRDRYCRQLPTLTFPAMSKTIVAVRYTCSNRGPRC